jgi:hypothetical protein
MSNKFWNGMEVTVLANVPGSKNRVIVRCVEDFRLDVSTPSNGLDFMASKKDLEPLIFEAFCVGEPVTSTIGTLNGRITSFEYHTNRAVVTSSAIENYRDKRTRYAYKHYELAHVDLSKIKLIPGCWYMINGNLKLIAVESVFNPDEVMLFDRNGQIIFKDLPKYISNAHLETKFDIEDITYVGTI